MNRRRTRRRSWQILPAAAVIATVSLAGPARGSTILRLTDLNSEHRQIVIDEAVAGAISDSGLIATAEDSAAGYPSTLMYVGPVGSFDVVVATGNSQPAAGTPAGARIDLVSLVVSGGTGDLEIELTDTDFRLAPGATFIELRSNVGGTTDGVVTAEAFLDPANREFGTSIAAGPLGPFDRASGGIATDKSFAGFARTTASLTPGQEFSLTQRAVIRHPGGTGDEATSFDGLAEVHTPEPPVLAMCLTGLACLGFWARRRCRERR